MKIVVTMFVLLTNVLFLTAQVKCDAIIGKWVAYPKENMVIEIFKIDGEFNGRLIWFKISADSSKTMAAKTDDKNPDPELRNRKLLMCEVMQGMRFNSATAKWEGGTIYDAKAGKIWKSSAKMRKDGTLEVRGFWHYEFIGQSLIFRKE